jgi:hypothetical protein
MKYWKLIADNLSKAGWSCPCRAAAAAQKYHRDDDARRDLPTDTMTKDDANDAAQNNARANERRDSDKKVKPLLHRACVDCHHGLTWLVQLG